MEHNNGRYFSAYDRDYDNYNDVHCAATDNGWWYGFCSNAFLNEDFSNRLRWGNTNFQTSQMLIQRTT